MYWSHQRPHRLLRVIKTQILTSASNNFVSMQPNDLKFWHNIKYVSDKFSTTFHFIKLHNICFMNIIHHVCISIFYKKIQKFEFRAVFKNSKRVNHSNMCTSFKGNLLSFHMIPNTCKKKCSLMELCAKIPNIAF